MTGGSKCRMMIENLTFEMRNHFSENLRQTFDQTFKFYKLSEPANGVLSLQMAGDVRLCFYNNTQPASVTEVPLWFIDHTESQCGKLSSTCYSH